MIPRSLKEKAYRECVGYVWFCIGALGAIGGVIQAGYAVVAWMFFDVPLEVSMILAGALMGMLGARTMRGAVDG